MKVIPLSEVKAKLSELVDVVERRDESITITRNGRPVAMRIQTPGNPFNENCKDTGACESA